MRGESKCVSEAKYGQSFVCLCVKNGWMKSLSVPRISEQLAKLDQWQSHSVYRRAHTHTGRFTHVSALLCPSTMTGTLSHPIPPSHEDTQTRLVVSLSTRKHTTLWAATPSPRHLAFLTNYPEMSDLGDLSLSTLKIKYCLSNFFFFFLKKKD